MLLSACRHFKEDHREGRRRAVHGEGLFSGKFGDKRSGGVPDPCDEANRVDKIVLCFVQGFVYLLKFADCLCCLLNRARIIDRRFECSFQSPVRIFQKLVQLLLGGKTLHSSCVDVLGGVRQHPWLGVALDVCVRGEFAERHSWRLPKIESDAGISAGAALRANGSSLSELLCALGDADGLLSSDGITLIDSVRVHEPAQGGRDSGVLADLLMGNGDLTEPARHGLDLRAPARRRRHGGGADGGLGQEPIHAE